jgi:hypothetical protein
MKPAAIRSTKLMSITGNDAGHMNDSTIESGKPGSMGQWQLSQ